MIKSVIPIVTEHEGDGEIYEIHQMSSNNVIDVLTKIEPTSDDDPLVEEILDD